MCKYFKRVALTSLAVLIALAISPAVNAQGSQTISFNGVTINAVDVAEGQLTLTGKNETGKHITLMVRNQDLDSTRYYDTVNNQEIFENVILEDGIGNYIIYAMIGEDASVYSYGPCIAVKNIGAVQAIPSSYEYVASYEETTVLSDEITEDNDKDTTLEITNEVPVAQPQQVQTSSSDFLAQSKDIDSEYDAIKSLSSTLTAEKNSDREKIESIYIWVAENLTYDFDKYGKMVNKDFSDSFGSISAIENKKGVCYDYSTLLAALCRASGVQAKVIKGYSTNIVGYHAWNEVFDSTAQRWITIDVTLESLQYHRNTNKTVGLTERSQAEYAMTSEM